MTERGESVPQRHTPRREPPKAGPVTIRRPDGTSETLPPYGKRKLAKIRRTGKTRAPAARKTVTCYGCGERGLVWGRYPNGAVRLVYPEIGSLRPNLDHAHVCIRTVPRARRKSDWRRGRSPSSYG